MQGLICRGGLVVLLAGMLGVGTAAAQGDGEAPTLRLGAGKVAGQRWEVSISRPDGPEGKGPKGRLRPCLTTGVFGPYQGPREPNGAEYTTCVVSPILRTNQEPLVTEHGDITPKRDIERKMTAVAVAFAPGVARVELTNFDGTVRTLRVRRLSHRQATRVHLARLGYVVFSVAGPYCVDDLVAYGPEGGVLYHRPKPDRCPPEEFPNQRP